jgi:hypothetical protein
MPVPGYYITSVIDRLRLSQIPKYALNLCAEHAFRDVSKLSPTDPVKEAVKFAKAFGGAVAAYRQKVRSPN